MYLIFLLDAKKDKLCKMHNLQSEEITTIKIDDKYLAHPKFILNKIKEKSYKNVFFGCIKLDYQRFHFFMKLYFLLSGYLKGAIIDEDGRKKTFNFFKLLFVELPFFLLEVLLSIFVIIWAYIKFPFMKWYLTKK